VKVDLGDLNAFVAVARARGFRDGARASGASASGLSEAVSRLEAQLGVRLLNRTTRSVVLTEVGQRLLERLGPALTEVETALDVVNSFRDRPAGKLRINVPVSAARLVLPTIVPRFLAAYPDIQLEVIARTPTGSSSRLRKSGRAGRHDGAGRAGARAGRDDRDRQERRRWRSAGHEVRSAPRSCPVPNVRRSGCRHRSRPPERR